VFGFPLTGLGEQDYGAMDCPRTSRRSQAGGAAVMVGIPTASTSGPSQPPRSPRAVVFSEREGGAIAGDQARHRQLAYRMSHPPPLLRVTDQDEFS
jgi:hypothetical protein